MTTTSDLRYGRRGGRWASPDAGHHAQAITDAMTAGGGAGERPRVELDPERLFHPETIARARAHDRSCRHGRNDPCPAEPDPADLAAIWAGRARMARARRAAGAPLSDLDRQALAMHPTGDATT
jgi:hypothetical protein